MMEAGNVDPGFPDSQSQPAYQAPRIRFDPSYIRTLPGILKIVQMALNLIGYICCALSMANLHSRGAWFDFVSMTGFWLTGILLVLYLMHIVEKFQQIPWMLIEVGYTGLWTFFYFTCSMAVAVWGGQFEMFAAAAFFGFAAMFAYGADFFFKFKGFRSGEVAQGSAMGNMPNQDLQSPGAY